MTSERPLVTFAVLSYNQQQYIGEAVRSAFQQTYSPLEVIISDDASTDGSIERIQALAASYTGPHRVVVNRNSTNLGLGGHVNKVMELARGDIIVAAAGDDVSDPDRVEALVEAFTSRSEKPYSVWSAARYIDEGGRVIGRKFPGGRAFTDATMVRNIRPVIGATHAWRREVFDIFGPLLTDVMFEDNAISFRSHLLGSIGYIDRELVSYRTHRDNISNFTRLADPTLLYANAARRISWALVGIEQRQRDLALAASKVGTSRDTKFLHRELKKLGRTFERRLRSYRQFPSLRADMLAAAFCDMEIAKVVARAIIHRIHPRAEAI